MHPTGTCAVWKSLSLKEKKARVNCTKCPFGGLDTKHKTEECKKTNLKCHNCLQEDDHHTWFCFRPKSKTKSSITKTLIGGESNKLPPVMVKTTFITTASPCNNRYGKLGGMFDDCSTDHYNTNEEARKYNFPGRRLSLRSRRLGALTKLSLLFYIQSQFLMCME